MNLLGSSQNQEAKFEVKIEHRRFGHNAFTV